MPHMRKKMEKCEAHYLPYLKEDEKVRDKLRYYDMFHSRQADYLSGESGYPLYGNTETEYLCPGEKILEKMLGELQKAEKYISEIIECSEILAKKTMVSLRIWTGFLFLFNYITEQPIFMGLQTKVFS